MAADVIALLDLAPLLPARGRLLGLDLGTKTIGMALSDVERRLATPLDTIRRVKFNQDLEKLAAVLGRYDIQAVVIGLPLNMDGSEGPRVQSTRSFVRNAGSVIQRPIVFWDERLSTAAVTRDLIANDVSRAKRAAVVDQMAAAFILQGALDRLARITQSASGDGSAADYMR